MDDDTRQQVDDSRNEAASGDAPSTSAQGDGDDGREAQEAEAQTKQEAESNSDR